MYKQFELFFVGACFDSAGMENTQHFLLQARMWTALEALFAFGMKTAIAKSLVVESMIQAFLHRMVGPPLHLCTILYFRYCIIYIRILVRRRIFTTVYILSWHKSARTVLKSFTYSRASNHALAAATVYKFLIRSCSRRSLQYLQEACVVYWMFHMHRMLQCLCKFAIEEHWQPK